MPKDFVSKRIPGGYLWVYIRDYLRITWSLYSGKKKKPMRKINFGDECGSWEEHNKSSHHLSPTITILSLPQLHMAVVLQ
jgi:hypothetical protein